MFFFSSPLLHVPSPLHLRPLKSNAAEKNLTSDGHKAALHHKTQACSGSTNLPPQSPPSPEVKRPVYALGWRNRLVFTQSESHRNTPAKSTKAQTNTHTHSLSPTSPKGINPFLFSSNHTHARAQVAPSRLFHAHPTTLRPPSLPLLSSVFSRPTDRPTDRPLLTPHVASRRVHCLRFRCGWAGAGGEGAPHASPSRRVPPLFRENLRASHACPPPCTS